MRRAWRFFVGADGRWQWQMIGPNATVLASSPSSYDIYEQCIAAAASAGYAYEEAQAPLPRTRTSAGRSSGAPLVRDPARDRARLTH